MIHGYMMPKYLVAHPQHSDKESIRENDNPKACTREAVTIYQMHQPQRLPESLTTSSIHNESNVTHSTLSGFSM